MTTREKLIKWGIFSILFALVPFAFSYGKASLVGPPLPLSELVARGGLLLVAVGLATGAIGDLIGSEGEENLAARLVVGGLCAIIAVSSSLFYVVVSDAYTKAMAKGIPLEKTELNMQLAIILTIVLYIAAVVGSGACIAIAKESSREQT